ncbi:unnamed protein product [Heterosigma akashiwo]
MRPFCSGAILTKSLGVTETDFSNLPILLVLCNLSSLLPLPLLSWIKDQDVSSDDGESEIQ